MAVARRSRRVSQASVVRSGRTISVTGSKGSLSRTLPGAITVREDGGTLLVERPDDERANRALHGLTRSLVANMVEGVTKGYERKLEIQGVGYRAALRGTSLELSVGFSHPVVIDPRQGISFEVPTPTEVIVKGIDKQQVGQTAAEVRRVRTLSRR